MDTKVSSRRIPRQRTLLFFILGFCSASLCALYVLSNVTGHSAVSQGFGHLSTEAGSLLKPGVSRGDSVSAVHTWTKGVKPFNNNQMRRTLTSHLPSASCKNASLSPSKLILLWTSFFGHWEYFPQGPYDHCSPCSNCQVTTDRKRLSESDAVVFHARDMSLSDLPRQRSPHQVWIFYCLESPEYSSFPGLNFMHNMFNWTMTYRSDSDIYAPYGMLKKVTPGNTSHHRSLLGLWKNKTKSVVWMCSHCPTYSARDDFIAQLRKHVDVDVYGSCGDYECPRNETEECFHRFEREYMFFLAFENSICKDYVTEKFFRALRYDMVPVVFGGADYGRHAPGGSYVDALSFRSPKHLASYLDMIAKDFSSYSAYFRWREDHVVHMTNAKECTLCNRLHESNHMTSVYKNMRKWWIDDSKCWSWRDDSR